MSSQCFDSFTVGQHPFDLLDLELRVVEIVEQLSMHVLQQDSRCNKCARVATGSLAILCTYFSFANLTKAIQVHVRASTAWWTLRRRNSTTTLERVPMLRRTSKWKFSKRPVEDIWPLSNYDKIGWHFICPTRGSGRMSRGSARQREQKITKRQ